MTEFWGALGLAQVPMLGSRLVKRKSNYARLAEGLKDFKILDLGGEESAAYCLVVRLPEGKSQVHVRAHMFQKGVETSIYYPGPLPLMRYFREIYEYKEGDFSHAEDISHNTLALSVGPHLGWAEMDYQAETFKEAVK